MRRLSEGRRRVATPLLPGRYRPPSNVGHIKGGRHQASSPSCPAIKCSVDRCPLQTKGSSPGGPTQAFPPRSEDVEETAVEVSV
jgi:hypothetical protein